MAPRYAIQLGVRCSSEYSRAQQRGAKQGNAIQVGWQPATRDSQLRRSQRIHTSRRFRTKRNTRTALQDTSMSFADHHRANVSRVPAHAREVVTSALSSGRRQSHGDEESTCNATVKEVLCAETCPPLFFQHVYRQISTVMAPRVLSKTWCLLLE